MESVWNYLLTGFLAIIILVQWYTNKWAIEERDWYKQKCISMFPQGKQIQAASRLYEEFVNRRRV